MKDYYKILGLQEGVSDDDIRRTYKKLAMEHHPDRGGNLNQFQEIQEAYSVLTDPQKKAEWQHQRQFGHAQTNQGPFGFSFNFSSDINEIFRQFHGQDPFAQFRQPRNSDLRTSLEIDLASTLNPQSHHIHIKSRNGQSRMVKIDIPRGVQNGMQMRCSGHGDHSVTNQPPGDLYVDIAVRPSGGFTAQGINLHKKINLNCIDAILGSKITVRSLDNRDFDIVIPPATQHGSSFRLTGQGLWDINQPLRGDMIVEIMLDVPKTITQEQMVLLQNLGA
ncbi:J domain-containing protein [bacterium]|nr:J domain-containing protein [bacterium]